MRIESRRDLEGMRGLVLIVEDERESLLIDECFGEYPDDDGLIGERIMERIVEARLSDGYGQHYLYVKAKGVSHARHDVGSSSIQTTAQGGGDLGDREGNGERD